jgi:hypothetical protein
MTLNIINQVYMHRNTIQHSKHNHHQKVDLPCMLLGSFWKPFFSYDQIKDPVLKLLVFL